MRKQFAVLICGFIFFGGTVFADSAVENKKTSLFQKIQMKLKNSVSEISAATNRNDRRGGKFDNSEAIKKYDTDGDGKLNEAEKKVADAAREKEMLTKFDTDGDGVLSDTEKAAMEKDRPAGKFMPPGGPMGKNASGSADFEAKRIEFLSKYDTDGDGSLSDIEKDAMEKDRLSSGAGNSQKRTLTKEQVATRKAALLKMFDGNGDGSLSDTEKATAKNSFQKYYSEYSQEEK
ncbi:MAG: hypothetical protein WA705_18790 [Candidatus Ozemobacteraceae bacterium]